MTDTSGYMQASNKLRVMIRQAIPDGFFLIVDDDDSVCIFFETVLKGHGLRAEHVSNIDDAQTMINENRDKIICIIIDLNLPSGSGEDLIREIERNYSNIPYLVSTGEPARAAKVIEHFPRANVFYKGHAIDTFLTALGLESERR